MFVEKIQCMSNCFLCVATRQLEALFNLSQLLFGLARSEQANYTFRDLQLGQSARLFREAGFKIFRKHIYFSLDFIH